MFFWKGWPQDCQQNKFFPRIFRVLEGPGLKSYSFIGKPKGLGFRV